VAVQVSRNIKKRQDNLRTEILDVGIGSESGVIREIPARVIWIVVQHDVVGVPQPIAGVVVVVWRDAPVKTAEPETVPASAFEAINVVAANFTAESSVFPYMVLMVTLVIPAGVVTDPSIALGMHVRGFGMACLVAIRLTSLPLVATRAPATGTAAIISSLRLSGTSIWRRPVIGDVSAANLRRGAALASAASALTLSATSASLLGKCR
jgi:hypothetical protein